MYMVTRSFGHDPTNTVPTRQEGWEKMGGAGFKGWASMTGQKVHGE